MVQTRHVRTHAVRARLDLDLLRVQHTAPHRCIGRMEHRRGLWNHVCGLLNDHPVEIVPEDFLHRCNSPHGGKPVDNFL